MNSARSLGMAQWLQMNRSEECTAGVMNSAVQRGDSELVLHLHTHLTEGYAENAFKVAARSRQFEMFQWLCETYPRQPSIDKYCKGADMKDLFKHMGVPTSA